MVLEGSIMQTCHCKIMWKIMELYVKMQNNPVLNWFKEAEALHDSEVLKDQIHLFKTFPVCIFFF